MNTNGTAPVKGRLGIVHVKANGQRIRYNKRGLWGWLVYLLMSPVQGDDLMYSFNVLKDFKVTPEMKANYLEKNVFCVKGDVCSGLTRLEAGELLELAPPHTFSPANEASETLFQQLAKS